MIPLKRCLSDIIAHRSTLLGSTSIARSISPHFYFSESRRGKKISNKTATASKTIYQPLKPVPVKLSPDDINVGAELTGNLNKNDLLKVINLFATKQEVSMLAGQQGMDVTIQKQAMTSFRLYILESESLPVDLHVILSDILQGAGNVMDIFPYFAKHAKEIFPHLDCMDELKKIGDLRLPANWYPFARAKTRKIIFHAGPTNSGKTYHALERFMNSESGVYCGPLKLLAAEVFHKCNNKNTPCDLVTGEERLYAVNEVSPANHVACTVEMARTDVHYEVAVIDEIQMIKDTCRGWAWTRALLGISADEIHICGEVAAIDLIRLLCATTGENLEVRQYKRLTELHVETEAIGSLDNIKPGDCIVCFSKNDIYTITRELEARGVEVSVIYGSLPPNTKLAQAAKFNDPNHPCKVLVATDAIGMGLNLHIRRVIFYSLSRPKVNDKGEREMETLPVSSVLQIAGRAGRYGTQYETGYTTTFDSKHLSKLTYLMKQTPEILTQAGLHPTSEQIELFAYHLPKSPLSNLMDIFVSLCTVDNSLYFMCQIDDFKFLADTIQHVPLPLRARYVFCCAPINRKFPFVCTMFLKFARQYSRNEAISFEWLCLQMGWPIAAPKTVLDLIHLEAVFDVLDLYLWLSYRFYDLFPDISTVKDMQKELDLVIQDGVMQITKLLKNSVADSSSNIKTTNTIGGGRLTERLLAQGLLTPDMLQELKREWKQGKHNKDTSDDAHKRNLKKRGLRSDKKD